MTAPMAALAAAHVLASGTSVGLDVEAVALLGVVERRATALGQLADALLLGGTRAPPVARPRSGVAVPTRRPTCSTIEPARLPGGPRKKERL